MFALFSKLLIIRAIVVVLVVFLVKIPEFSKACGPGRSGGHRRHLRKYPPLVQRQYIPNVSENTLRASGLPEGAIRRKDKRFRELVQNWNPDIEFKDQERTGADRMMSQRLKEKLSILAISVMNQWPNVRLRVIEGWDENGEHGENSLHYEGRAVDITTSDRDRTKYGMLARLAVEAGFDWVHYEAKTHVHCSVKSEKADTIRNNGCFDAASLVETPQGQMEMSKLQLYDQVLTMNFQTGQLQYSPVLMWLDRDELDEELYVELQTKSSRLIHLTSSHLLFVADQPLDLTQQAHELVMTGNNSTNQNKNNYYYNINTEVGESYGVQEAILSTNVPSSNNSRFKSTRIHSVSKTDSNIHSLLQYPKLSEITYTTYAQNVIVGQYLLVNRNMSKLKSEDDWKNIVQNQTLTYRSQQVSASANRLKFADRSAELEAKVQIAPNSAKQVMIELDQIVSVNYVKRKGIYAPLTREGNIIVNSVVASCYAVVSDHDLAHLSFAPVRWFNYINEWIFGPLHSPFPLRERTTKQQSANERNDFPKDTQASNLFNTPQRRDSSRQIHWYPQMLYSIAKFVMPSRFFY